MSGDGRAVPRAARWAALVTAVTLGALLVVVVVYLVYVYTLWMRALQAEGPISATPP
ncbi:MAG TPA: hypothetical protein VNN19_08650 [bacterium]|nr:hypothetical protein [bacterium]